MKLSVSVCAKALPTKGDYIAKAKLGDTDLGSSGMYVLVDVEYSQSMRTSHKRMLYIQLQANRSPRLDKRIYH